MRRKTGPAIKLLLVILIIFATRNVAAAQYLSMNEPNMVSVPVELKCIGEGHRVTSTDKYLIALHHGDANSVRDQYFTALNSGGTNAKRQAFIMANLVAYVRAGNQIMPLLPVKSGSAPSAYKLDCKANRQLRETNPSWFPTIKIDLLKDQSKVDLLNFLRMRQSQAERKQILQPMLFSGSNVEDGLIDLPRTANGKLTFKNLIEHYFDERPEAAFISASGSRALISAPWSGALRIGLKIASSGGVKPNQAQSLSEAVIESLAFASTKIADVRIAVRAKAWAAIDLSKQLDTFGYCKAVVREGANRYRLKDCTNDTKLRVPFKLPGFDLAFVPKKGGMLDDLLVVSRLQIPYPPDWKDPSGKPFTIEGGRLVDVLGAKPELRQWGFAGCSAKITVTLADILARTIKFPALPCQSYKITLPKELFAASPPKLIEGCVPAAVSVKVGKDGVATCLHKAADGDGAKLAVRWSTDFEDFEVKVPVTFFAKGASLAADELLGALRPLWPYGSKEMAELFGGQPDVPNYQPSAITYVGAKEGICAARPAPLEPASQLLPSLGEFGCKQLPESIRFKFVMAPKKTKNKVHQAVFKTEFVHEVPLRDIAKVAGKIPPTAFSKSFPIQFSKKVGNMLNQQFGEKADLQIRGVQVFQDENCQGGDTPVVVRFDQASKPIYQWPAYALINDNDGIPLTNCAKAVFARNEAGKGYLTFSLRSTRAIGSRRAVVIARSQEFMNKRGVSRALTDALKFLVQQAHARYQRGAALSPVNVLSVRNDGTMEQLFTGEQAALTPQDVVQRINALDRTGPRTIDLSLLQTQPGIRDFSSLVVIMDGSIVNRRQVNQLKVLDADLKGAIGSGKLFFFLSSESCILWQPHAKHLTCVDLGSLRQRQRTTKLLTVLAGLLNPAPK